MKLKYITGRNLPKTQNQKLLEIFQDLVTGNCDVEFLDSNGTHVIGISGLIKPAPVLKVLLSTTNIMRETATNPGKSLLICYQAESGLVNAYLAGPDKVVTGLKLEENDLKTISDICSKSKTWAGTLDDQGRHIFDPKLPSPGPHFTVNLLMGDRSWDESPLQTTPKSVVDGFGRGSFRSHAATQVLASRWDLRQEENGFPANRQIYLTEGDNKLWYSGDLSNTEKAECIHEVNQTSINVVTSCGLAVNRTIFIAPYETGLPLACEIQKIDLENQGKLTRDIRLLTTGMFGPSKPGALMEDVLYSNIILQAGMLLTDSGEIAALAPDYYPLKDRDDLRFHSLVLNQDGKNHYPTEFCTDIRDFLGNGTLENPQGIGKLSNRLSRKGPGFFALGKSLTLKPGAKATFLSFTGLVSKRGDGSFSAGRLEEQIGKLLALYSRVDKIEEVLTKKKKDFENHISYFQIKTADRNFNSWVNRNLPFQVFYQTFVSRSFCQTQKGYREIGFREIQDLFASMDAFCASGRGELVENLLGEWASHVHEFGFADHNFYWEGKEPGLWSDDALWLVQAVSRFIDLTGDISFLSRELSIADQPNSKRTVYQTLKAIIRYSGKISVGNHGLPLLDKADWNDCLKVDVDFQTGKNKHEMWKSRPGKNDQEAALGSEGTESVMNAFLLHLAALEYSRIADLLNDPMTSKWAREIAGEMATACHNHAWKDHWFARLLINRDTKHPFAGGPGDGLSTDSNSGCLFLNSFSWSVLSGVATESQIAKMYPVLEQRLRTEFGYQLVTPHDLRRIEPTVASSEYFPGDRENGGVFKHASLMAVSALFQAAATVSDPSLASQMTASAWWMLGVVAPSRSMDDPFGIAGNPRFCTQYNNSETGENTGPLLSGTASWSTLAIRLAFGIQITPNDLVINPLLRFEDQNVQVTIPWNGEKYIITYIKPVGFFRRKDSEPKISFDGQTTFDGRIPRLNKRGTRVCEVRWD